MYIISKNLHISDSLSMKLIVNETNIINNEKQFSIFYKVNKNKNKMQN